MEKFLKRSMWLVILAPAIYLAFVWNSLPASIPTHFDMEGNADRYGSRFELLWLLAGVTGLNIALYLLLPRVYKIDPKKFAAENKGRLYRIACAVAFFLSVVLCYIVYHSRQGNVKAGAGFLVPAMGLLFAILGNYLYNIKPNYFAGFRLPWTLSNDENWRKTHLLGGKLFFADGIIIALSGLFLPFKAAMISLFVILTVTIIITCVYSYRLYKKQKAGLV